MAPISRHNPANPAEIASLLKQSLASDRLDLLQLVADEAARRRMPLYIVGGFVRDLLLGRPALDFDLVVEGDAIALARALAAMHGGKVTTHTPFQTAQWFLPAAGDGLDWPPVLDLITARSETYSHPGALPKVKPGTLADDLRRRDFTINTLALRLEGVHYGEIRDDLGGLDDLEKGRIRVLHSNSYTDDPTRILRAVRYEQRYGFQILAGDLTLIARAKSSLGSLSGERLRHELDLILAEEKAAAMLSRLAQLDVLRGIHPWLVWDDSLPPVFEALDRAEPDSWRGVPDLLRVPRRIALGYLVWLGNLKPGEIESLAARLDFSAPLRDALLAASALYSDLPALVDAKPSTITVRLDEAPLLAICAFSVKVPTESVSIPESVIKSVDSYLSTWRFIKPGTTGHDLIRRGLPPGPAYQSILSRLRAAWLDGEVKSVEEEAVLLDKLIKLV